MTTDEQFYRLVAAGLSRLSPRTRKEEKLLKESLARLAEIKRSKKKGTRP